MSEASVVQMWMCGKMVCCRCWWSTNVKQNQKGAGAGDEDEMTEVEPVHKQIAVT